MSKILDDLFNDEILEKIGKLVDKPINQSEKIDKLEKILGKEKLNIFDSGTNRVIFTNKNYPKVVFKVAMDPQGVLDNLNEYEKSDKSKYFPDSHGIDSDGYVLVQSRCKLFDQDEFSSDKIRKRIRTMMKKLEDDFVLLDLGMDKRKNFGITKDGEIQIVDFGYVTYKDLANFNCPVERIKNSGRKIYCKGRLEYTKDYSMMVCPECGNIFKVDVVLEGHGEYKYVSPPKNEAYEPTDELVEFYKKFNNSRDRELLKEYVKINNQSNTNNMKGEDKPMNGGSIKDRFLRKVTGVSGSDPVNQTPVVSGYRDSNYVNKKPVVSTWHSSYDKIGNGIVAIHKDADSQRTAYRDAVSEDFDDDVDPDQVMAAVYNQTMSDDADILKPEEELLVREGTIRNLLPKGADGDEIISDLFYERFPDIKSLVEDSCSEEVGMPESGIIHIDDNITVDRGIYEVTIEINTDDNKSSKSPCICVVKNGITYMIDILRHIKHLSAITEERGGIDKDDPTVMVTYMYAEPVEEFDGDYEKRYYDSDGSEDTPDDADVDDTTVSPYPDDVEDDELLKDEQ